MKININCKHYNKSNSKCSIYKSSFLGLFEYDKSCNYHPIYNKLSCCVPKEKPKFTPPPAESQSSRIKRDLIEVACKNKELFRKHILEYATKLAPSFEDFTKEFNREYFLSLFGENITREDLKEKSEQEILDLIDNQQNLWNDILERGLGEGRNG